MVASMVVLGSRHGLVLFVFKAGFFQIFGGVGKTIVLGGFFSIRSWASVDGRLLQGGLLGLVWSTTRSAWSGSGGIICLLFQFLDFLLGLLNVLAHS